MIKTFNIKKNFFLKLIELLCLILFKWRKKLRVCLLLYMKVTVGSMSQFRLIVCKSQKLRCNPILMYIIFKSYLYLHHITIFIDLVIAHSVKFMYFNTKCFSGQQIVVETLSCLQFSFHFILNIQTLLSISYIFLGSHHNMSAIL